MTRISIVGGIGAIFTRLLRGRRRVDQRFGVRPGCEVLEDRCLPAFSVIESAVFGTAALRLVADLNQPVNAATVQAGDLVLDGAQPATSVNVVDADTVEFFLPTLGAGAHAASIAAGAMLDTQGTGLDAFDTSFTIASAAQLAMKHNPRLQPGNAPLSGYAGSALDRVDVLWQTIPGGAGTQDSFAVEYRAVGATAWQSTTLNAAIDTGVEGRVVRSASITGLNWNSDYEYCVRHRQADVIVGEYQSTFTTRLQPGDASAFTFAAYGDSASGTATGFRQVQARINTVDPAFAVLLGDNVYTVGSHQESDARFSPSVNPEAAAWMAGHIDYLGLGNHDVGTGSGLPSEQNYSVPIPVAGVTAPAAPPGTERPEHSFSWDYGNVHFLTFDTNSYTDVTRLDALLNWAITDLNASTARWKIVYGHHPLAGVPDKPENPAGNYYHQVVNRLKAAGVDLFMTGHSHTYSWTYPLTGQINGTATYVNHGADDDFHSSDGLTQLVSGLGGVEIRPGDYSQFPFVAEGFTSTTPIAARLGFAQISVTPDQLTVAYVAANDGAVIDSFVISKDNNLQTTTFQQGANGYSGAVDTYLHQNAPTTSNATATSLKVDGDDPAASGFDVQALLRFDNIFGGGAGQIPTNATLRSATLQLQVTNGSANNMNLHRMVSAWSATDTWNTLVGGVQTDDVDALAAPDTSSGQSQIGVLSFNVLASLQAWLANPALNRGWAIVPTGTDGVDFHSSEGTSKPKLIISYVPNSNTPPTNSDIADQTTNEDTATGALVFTVGDAETAPAALTVSATSSNPALVPNANLVLGGSEANRTLTATPLANQSGTATITVTVSDGAGATASDTFLLTVVAVNDAPVAVNDSATASATTPVAIAVLANDTDIEGSALSASLVATPSNGSAVVNANNTITYTANAGFSGADTFTYRANDDTANSNVATVTVTVLSATKFHVVDSTADKSFAYQANGGYLTQSSLSNTNARGVAASPDGTKLWVLDSNKNVYVYNSSMVLLGSWTASGLKTPTGISVAGADVWIVDSNTDRAYLYAGAATRLSGSAAATRSFALGAGNTNPQDLVTDGVKVWVVHSGTTDKIFVYQASNGLSLGNWTISGGNTTPTGLTLDPTGVSNSLWTVDSGTDRIYEYANSRDRTSGAQAASLSVQLNSANGNAQGIADPPSGAAASASVSLTTAFESLRSTAIWPVSGSTLNNISSTLGPRIKASSSSYDWHRGIDISTAEGTPVLAPLAGTFFGIRNYVDGGLTVILKHLFPEPVLFGGKTLTSFYTYYMHLSSVDPSLQSAADAGQTPTVAQGFEIGRAGHSGTALSDHLHWEIRVGSPYSLEWQLANPTSQYGANAFGFDPHVHPLLLTIPTATNTLAASLTTKPTNRIDGRVRITTDDEQPLFNRVQMKIIKKSTNLTVADHALDLNERLGFNATTNALLDAPDLPKPYLAPISFGTSAPIWSTDLVIPKSWVGSNYGSKFQTVVTFTDIWGRTKTITW